MFPPTRALTPLASRNLCTRVVVVGLAVGAGHRDDRAGDKMTGQFQLPHTGMPDCRACSSQGVRGGHRGWGGSGRSGSRPGVRDA